MKKFSYLAALVSLAVVPAAAQAADAATAGPAVAVKGKMIYGAGGKRLGAVYRVLEDGSAQVIVDGKLKTVPAATISNTNGKLATSLSKKELL